MAFSKKFVTSEMELKLCLQPTHYRFGVAIVMVFACLRQKSEQGKRDKQRQKYVYCIYEGVQRTTYKI